MSENKPTENKSSEKNLSKPAWKKVSVIAAVVIFPLIYSFFYLYAFWDPYSRLAELPVAVVNNDRGAIIQGKEKNIGDNLIDNLKENKDVKWEFMSAAQAKKGLKDRKYYALVTIPEDFTQKISTADTTDKLKGILLYTLEEKRNFLAGQVLNRVISAVKDNVSKEITKAITNNMAKEMDKIPDKLGELGTGLGKLDTGASKVNSGTLTVLNGQTTLNEGILNLYKGLGTAFDSSVKLFEGSNTINDGLKKATEGTGQLSASMTKLSAGMKDYVSSQKQVNDSVANINNVVKSYLAHHPSAANDPEFAVIAGGMAKLSAAVPQLNGAAAQLEAGAGAASVGMGTINESEAKLSAGMNELNSGISKFSEGVKSAKDGSEKLLSGSTALKEGVSELKSGTKKLSAGIDTAFKKVNTSTKQASTDTKGLKGIGKYAAEPVKVEENKVNPVPDYGTAFTPYFVSLSLWVGALMMFFAIYLDPKMSAGGKKPFAFTTYTIIGVAQALILAVVLLFGLKLKVSSVPIFFATIIIISLSFVSIMRFLIVQLKDLGKFLAVLWLILQLTACGGTFPMELVPKFFQVINPFMPMTYSVNILREVISGIDYGFFSSNVLTLAGIGVAFLLLNIALSHLRNLISKKNSKVEVTA